jgi:hypothetical protein
MSEEGREYLIRGTADNRESAIPVQLPGNQKYNKPDSTKKKKEGASIEKEKVGKVVEGKVTRKTGFGKKFRDSLIAGTTGSETLSDFFVNVVVIPAIKGMISDAVNTSSEAVRDGVRRFLYGDRQSRSSTYSSGGYTAYNRAVTRTAYGTISSRARARHDFADIIIEQIRDAQFVLDEMRRLISEYGQVSVAEFYGLAGIPADFPDENWGWYNLESAHIAGTRGGWIIRLPQTQQLESR